MRTASLLEAVATPAAQPKVPLLRSVTAPPVLSVSQGSVPSDAPVEPILDIHDIQGNSLVGFNKDFQAFLFFRITKVVVAKRWIAQIAPRVATVAETLAWRQLFRSLRVRSGIEPAGLVATWLNIALTNSGVKQLCGAAELERFTDDAFKRGMERRAGLLGDRVDTTPARAPVGWVVGAKERYPDILVILASDSATALETELVGLIREIEHLQGRSPRRANEHGLHLIHVQSGADLGGGLKGHEHFGFKDGVSQPGIRGRTSEAPEAFLTPRLIDPAEPLAMTHGRPGQPLIWPGQFVLGEHYPRQRDDDRVQPAAPVPPEPAWARNGSFLVFRRLEQDVPGFWTYMVDEAARLAKMPGFEHLTAVLLAALCMGRWPSGAPLIRAPLADDPLVASNDVAVNNFNFSNVTEHIRLRPGSKQDEFAPIAGDSVGERCPFAAHIRKVNPRDQNTSDLGPDERTLLRRVLRRGIPYGRPVKDPLVRASTSGKRGLLFVSYQASIVDQFEFLQTRWANSPLNPHSYEADGAEVPAGHDPVIGQASKDGRRRSFTLRGRGGQIEAIVVPSDFVTTTGGGYFFAPSISALIGVISGQDTE